MLKGLVLVVCHETLNNHLVGLYVHVVPAVGQCCRTALNRYSGPLAVVDGQFTLVVRQGLAIGQHFQECRLVGGHHAVCKELCCKVQVVCPRLVHGTVQGQIAVLGVLLHFRTEILRWLAWIHAYATAVTLCHGRHSASQDYA